MRALATLLIALLALALAAPPSPAAPPPELSASQAQGFTAALTPHAFSFPLDHGPHPDFRHEWWYVTGNLEGPAGERFGFELTFFRFALAPPPRAPAPQGSAWRAREIYMGHFAITDVAHGRFEFAQKLSRAALDLAGAKAPPLFVWIDDNWSLAAGNPGSDTSRGSAAPWRLRAAHSDYAIELTLLPQTAPVLNGERGLSRKASAPEDASYYYSLPRLEVHGRLERSGEPIPVRGVAWFDHEWGSGGLGANESGWDWFGLDLEDGSALMFYALRERSGGRDPHSAGTWIGSGAEAQALANEAVSIEVLDHWTNAKGTRYPSLWRVRVPALDLELLVRPVLADQELLTTPPYWEGAVDARGTRKGVAVGGRGYVELVGYAQER